MKRYFIAAAALFMLAAGVRAQNNPNKDGTVLSEMTVWTVTLHPRAIEAPLLQRTLLPRTEELEPGNAALHYYTAVMAYEAGNPKEEETVTELLDLPLEQLNDDVFNRVRLSDAVLHEMEIGAKRETVNWDHNLRQDGFRALLPGVNRLRILSRGVALEARAAIRDRRYDEAIRWLKVDYALARHMGEGDTLIEAMVDDAIAGLADIQLRLFMEQRDAPNLFWALATRVRLVDSALAFRQERAAVYYTFPELKEAREGKFHAGQWATFLAHFRDVEKTLGPGGATQNQGRDLESQAGQVVLGMALYGPAKAYLAAHGFKPEHIQTMPVEEVLMRGESAAYEVPADEMNAWMLVPYWQKNRKALEADPEISGNRNPLGLLAHLLSPAVGKAHLNMEKAERSRAVLATLEALRDYAAGHQGALPEKLDDVLGLPIPVDPIWNRAFEYKKDGNRATLTSMSPSPTEIRDGLRVDITMEK